MRGRDLAVIVGGILVAILLIGLLGGGMMGPGMMGWNGPGGYSFGWWGIVMAMMMLLFWGLVIGGVVWLIVSLVRHGQPTSLADRRPNALDILRERYARGEITREQLEQMRRDIEEK